MPQANKIVTAVTKRPPQRSTTQAIFVYSCIEAADRSLKRHHLGQANMDPVAENGAAAAASAASATASVVVVARIRPKLPKEDKEPDGGSPGFRSGPKKRKGKVNNFVPPNFAEIEVWRSTLMRRLCQSTTMGLDLG